LGVVFFGEKIQKVSLSGMLKIKFNQQNREYYSLRFSEVQKELSGMKVELGKIE